MSSLQEDAAAIAAARAKRRQLTDGLTAASELSDAAGLGTEGIYEALAAGRDKTDPDYWTFKIMQYLYEYVPFGKAGRWFVPVILGLGLYKAVEVIFDIVSSAWEALKGSPFYQTLKGFLPLPDRVVRDDVGNSAQVQMLQTGLMAVLPPYAALAVQTLAPKIGTSSDKQLAAENAKLKKQVAELQQLCASTAPTYSLMPVRQQVSPTVSAPPAASNNPDFSDILAAKGVDWALNKIDEWLASDRVVRDMNSSASLGLASRSRNNF